MQGELKLKLLKVKPVWLNIIDNRVMGFAPLGLPYSFSCCALRYTVYHEQVLLQR